MNVLSLFDGMSCGQIALNKSKLKVSNYFASEIKDHAIQVTKYNFPKTINLGDIRNVKSSDLPKIDLLIGGSPCQDFSIANRNRPGLEGKKSSLFFEYLRLLNELKPKYFLLENVYMPFEGYSQISNYIGSELVRINSSLISGQLRDRLYWTNIGGFNEDMFGHKTSAISQPKDKKIKLQSILTSGYTNRNKSRALLESDLRPLSSQDKMIRRYEKMGFTTLVFESPNFDWKKGVRYLDQRELEILQTVPIGYTKSLSRNKAACLLGDGWTVDAIVHIFSHMEELK
jgi:DNA (cytosine-5)-methyltransferase 3A